MKDYCAETLQKEKKSAMITLFSATLLCTVMLVIVIWDMARGNFQTQDLVFVALLGPVEAILLVKMLRSPFKVEKIDLVKNIRKQQPEGRQEMPLDYIFREINDDLNRSGVVVGPFLLGEKWLLAETERHKYELVNLSHLQGFAMGTLSRSKRRRPALALISEKLGLVECFSSQEILRQFYELLQNRYPELANPGDEDTNLGEWSMKYVLNAWQNRPRA